MRVLASLHLFFCLGAGCAQPNAAVTPGELDEAFYRCRVESVVVARCAFFACHGDPARPYRIYAPNRMRLDVTEDQRALYLTEAETRANYENAVGFSVSTQGYGYDEPLLVEKPLDEAIGGAYHEGAEIYGAGDVFTDPSDPELDLLRAWIAGAREETACVP
jgi:hypothetical protein